MSEKRSNAQGLGGLVNMGLTCYANAMIQVIRHIPRFQWLLETGQYTTLFQKDAAPNGRRAAQQKFTTSFAEIVQMLQKCQRGQSVRPAEFWKDVPRLVEDTMYEHLAQKAPHDSHEFFLFLLESIHEATAQEVDMRIVRPPGSTQKDKLIHGALTVWQKEFSKQYSPFVDLFFGLSHWRTTCQACGTVSHRWEPYNSLKISVPPDGSIDTPVEILTMLHEDMAPECIEGYQCEKCPKRTTAKRVMSIWSLPKSLILVLKRFTHTGRKIHTQIAPLPSIVNFTPFYSEDSPEKEGKGGQGAATHYTLRGIVDHHGGAGGGHYTAQCRNDDGWYIYDDEGVQAMPTSSPSFGSSTYILVLERVAVAFATAA